METKFNYFKIGLILFILFCVILTIFFIVLKEPNYDDMYNKELLIKKSSDMKDSGTYEKKIFGDKTITINTNNFICYNGSYFSKYNSEKAKFILGHEFLHYYDYKFDISNKGMFLHYVKNTKFWTKNKYHELLSKTQPLGLLQYVDTSITLLSEYETTFEQNKEAYVRFVNYCYYYRNNIVSKYRASLGESQYANNNNQKIDVCEEQDLETEFIRLDNFLHSKIVTKFINNICED